ncbi:LysR family transcriptional regulator [Rhodobacteraceae bacterium M382]|nr:LysR family transcriptional regulator [Rhodobacteraceae bacterium M382]
MGSSCEQDIARKLFAKNRFNHALIFPINRIMKIDDVELFQRIVSLGSVSAGGRACGLTATVASDRLKRLEADLGCTLLNRTTRSISMTGDGERFLQHAAELLRVYESARHSVGTKSVTPTGYLHVAAPALFARKFLSDPIHRYLVKYPDVRVKLMASDEVQNYTMDGIDVAIRIGKLADCSLIARKLGENHRVLCASPSYLQRSGTPKHPNELSEHECIVFMGEDSWHLKTAIDDVRVKVSGRLETNSADMATQAALNGQGIALRSLWDVADDLQAGRLVQVLPEYDVPNDLAIYAIYPPGRFISLAAKSFVELVRQNVKSIGQ